jgi:hypothetical protein
MPEKRTRKRAAKYKRQGKSGSTQAGEYVREEIHHVRKGKHGAKSAKQAIAIGLSKARRAGVKTGMGKGAQKKARQDSARKGRKPSASRSRGATKALKRQGSSAGSKRSLSRQAKSASRRRSTSSRSAAARKAARTRARRR